MASNLTINGLRAGYGSVQVLHDVAATVTNGETVVLLGSNGNGKSTLLKCIMGIITPTAGEILLTLEGETIGLIGKKPEEIVSSLKEAINITKSGKPALVEFITKENFDFSKYE